MECKVDYINFSVPTRIPFELGNPENEQNTHIILKDFLGQCYTPIFAGHTWELNESKGFYHTRYFDADAKISVFIGLVNKHVHCEVGGQALDFIRTLGCYEDFMNKVATRTSRVDFAVDFEAEDSVDSFIDNNYKGRFKAGGHIFSEDGETRYIGSWKGERFARVYRYHKPHPRSHKLRAEVVLRGDYAKQAMDIWISEGEVKATLAAHKPFKWSSPLWKPTEATNSEIKSHRSDKERAGTVRWLYGDVISAISKCHREGLIDVHDFVSKLLKQAQYCD
jgi:DNA relaxase NicK